MDSKIVAKAINHAEYYSGWRREAVKLILLYTDMTYEYVFAYDSISKKMNTYSFRDKTRDWVIAQLEREYYNGKIKGDFLDA